MTLIPLLGPPGTLPADWLSFLHDFPSRIPHTQRDSIVSIPWPESYISRYAIDIGATEARSSGGIDVGMGMGMGITRGVAWQAPRSDPRASSSVNAYTYRDATRRRSRSLDGIVRHSSPIPSSRLSGVPQHIHAHAHAHDQTQTQTQTQNPQTDRPTSTHGPPNGHTNGPAGERDAWILLLALAFAAFPSSRAAMKMRKLPVTVKLQMIAWLPPGV